MRYRSTSWRRQGNNKESILHLTLILTPLFLLWLIAMLYVGPTYFRRLGQLIDRLKSHHSDEFERLGRPSLKMLEMTIGSGVAIVLFVVRKNYLALSDDELTDLGDSARSRLIFSMIGPLIVTIMLPISAMQA